MSETTKRNINRILSDLLMTSLTEKLSYKNTDQWIEKLSEIPLDILKDIKIEYKFDINGDITEITRQKMAIWSQNVVSCIQFLIRYLGFQHN